MAAWSSPCAFSCSIARFISMRSERPTISFSVRKPSAAMYSRISCAMKRMKLTTCAGSPSNFFLSSGFCVAPGFELPVGLDRDAAAEIVQQQRLVRLGEAQLPREPRVLDGRLRRGAGAAVVAADEHDLGVAFGDARGDRADADFADELHADARVMVGVLEIVDQLREILDRINIVVRRRRDEADAGRRVAHLGDPRVDFSSRQLAALAGLGALRHLYLQFSRLS